MNDDKELVDTTKEIIMSDCVDSIFVARKEIVSYLRRNARYSKYFNGCNSKLSINKAVTLAIDELEKNGDVIKSGGEIRKPYNF